MPATMSAREFRRLTLALRPEHLHPDGSPRPSPALVRAAARRLTRDRKPDAAPPVLIIPNAKTLLGSERRVHAFQFALMDGIRRHFARHRPWMLRSRGVRTLAPPGQRGRPAATGRVRTHDHVTVAGLNSYRIWHMDEDSQLLISFCYSGFRDIRGGHLRLLDLRRLTGTCRKRDAAKVLLARRSEPFFDGESPFGPRHWVAMLRDERYADASGVQMVLSRLRYDRMPIVILSNRIEDGMLHGVTEPRQTGPKPRRKLRYVSVGRDTSPA